jgi:hypothetical protein
MRSPALVLTALALAAVPAAAHAQGGGPRIGLEVTGGLVFPLGDASDEFDNGTQLGANLLVDVTPALGLYGGYSHAQLPFANSDADLTLAGFEGGVRFSPGLALGPLSPTLTLGATYLEPEVSGGQAADSTGERKVGFRGGIGFDVPLGNVMTASLGGSLVSHPFGDFPQCPPSKPNCFPERMIQVSAGLRVYPPFLGGGR